MCRNDSRVKFIVDQPSMQSIVVCSTIDLVPYTQKFPWHVNFMDFTVNSVRAKI